MPGKPQIFQADIKGQPVIKFFIKGNVFRFHLKVCGLRVTAKGQLAAAPKADAADIADQAGKMNAFAVDRHVAADIFGHFAGFRMK